jgi:hypothetical protein
MTTKYSALKELGWSDDLIKAMGISEKMEEEEEYIHNAENPIKLQQDSTNLIISIKEPVLRSGQYLL